MIYRVGRLYLCSIPYSIRRICIYGRGMAERRVLTMSLPMSIPQYLPLKTTFSPPVRLSKCLLFSRLSLISCIAKSQEAVEEKRQRRHNAMRHFLLKECGLSLPQLSTVMSRDPSIFRVKSTHRAQQALKLLRDSGLTLDQVSKTIVRYPRILAFKADEQLRPKIEFFKTLGLDEEDVVRVISQEPRILACSLDKNLTPKIPLLQNLFGSKANLLKALKRAPMFMPFEIETLEMKLKHMKSIGLLEHEVKRLLLRDPRVLSLSVNKIQKNMDYLTHVAGFRPNIVVTYVQLLKFSVEKRMKPRHKVFQYLTTMLSPRHLTINLVTMLCMSEKEFTTRFLINHLEVAELYEKCKGKSDKVKQPKILSILQ